MKNLTNDRMQDLLGIILGEPRGTVALWLAPCRDPHLFFLQQGIPLAGEPPLLDAGLVPAVEEARRIVTVQNAGQAPLMVSVVSMSNWLDCRWKEGGAVAVIGPSGRSLELEIIIRPGKPAISRLSGAIRLSSTGPGGLNKETTLEVAAQAHVNFPSAHFLFNGVERSLPHDFGTTDPFRVERGECDYTLSVANLGTETLDVAFEGILSWLTIMKGQQSMGNEPAFKVPAGATVKLDIFPAASLEHLGEQEGVLIIHTTDPREPWKRIELPFQGCQEILHPHITYRSFPKIELARPNVHHLNIELFNWTRLPVYLDIQSDASCLSVMEHAAVDAWMGGQPGLFTLPFAVDGSALKAGENSLHLQLTAKTDRYTESFNIVLDILRVEVECKPEVLDFGVIEFDDRPVRELVVGFSEKSCLSIEIQVLEPAREFLEVRFGSAPVLVDSKRKKDKKQKAIQIIEVALTPPPLESVSKAQIYDGPGLMVLEKALGFQQEISIRFQRTAPVLDVSTLVIDLGDHSAGTSAHGEFSMGNRGVGLLNVEMAPEGLPFILETPSSMTLPEGTQKDVRFSLDFSGLPGNGEALTYSLFIQSNDSRGRNKIQVQIRVRLWEPFGLVCPECLLIADGNPPYCPMCGACRENARAAGKNDACRCSLCGSVYFCEYSYCPQDGAFLEAMVETEAAS